MCVLTNKFCICQVNINLRVVLAFLLHIRKGHPSFQRHGAQHGSTRSGNTREGLRGWWVEHTQRLEVKLNIDIHSIRLVGQRLLKNIKKGILNYKLIILVITNLRAGDGGRTWTRMKPILWRYWTYCWRKLFEISCSHGSSFSRLGSISAESVL